MTRKTVTLFVFSSTLFLIACSSGTNTPYTPIYNPPTNNPTNGGNSSQFTIPSRAGNPPSDILDHIVFAPIGGGEPGCPCALQNGDTVTLSKFTPNTNYRVVVYLVGTIPDSPIQEFQGLYQTHWDVQVDSYGSAVLNITGANDKNYDFIVFDENGNLVSRNLSFQSLDEAIAQYTEWAKAPCRDTYETQLKIGIVAHVSNTPPLANNVRRSFDVNSTKMGQIQPGEKVRIIDGPACNNGWIWWKIESMETGLTGWTSEGDDQNYWLVPSK